jgi:pimeloyl-ACP methyl ester carboxylesterase
MNLKIMGAILKKDVLSLYPLVLLTTLLFAGDVFLVRLELLPVWDSFRVAVLMLAAVMIILGVFQLDAPVSLVDDWLCRPVPKRELLTAKLVLVFAAIYLSRVVATVVADLVLGRTLAESLLDAVLLQDRLLWLMLPILLLTAVVTHTIIQGIGVLIAILVCVFVIPTPIVQRPDPLHAAIGEALSVSGMDWLATAPAKAVAMVLVAVGYWLAYWRRRILGARIALAATVLLSLFFVLLPMWLMPWTPVYALQTNLARPDAIADTNAIHVRNTRACFPATRLGNLAADAAFTAARQLSGLQSWSDEALRDSGPDAIAFLTQVEPRGLPLDWRVKLSYVQADYHAGGTNPLFSLRPAIYNTDTAGLLSHDWVLPEHAVQRLKGANAFLRVRYFLTLLKPDRHSLPVDGKRHELPGLGYCSAVRKTQSIDVECFSATHKPAQLSAELNDIPATRVYSILDLAPTWLQWPYGKHARLEIASPRLAIDANTITVTSWEVAAYLDEALEMPGILGAGVDTCPLPTTNGDSFQKSRWRDAAPHETYSISVEEGVQVEVLDFGGRGSPLLLLPGLGATAHSFDDLAPLLAQKHRVVAMTRRGTGYSSKPDFGFDTARLGQDVLEVMDAMDLKKVVLIGHSIAGEELTWLGGRHPERFDGLVYLDAAYDRSGEHADDSTRYRELTRRLPPEPPIPPAALQNYDTMSKFLAERGHVRHPEGELIAFFRLNNPYLAGMPNIDGRTQQAINAAIQAPDYEAVKIPALAIYAISDPAGPLPPWYDRDDKQLLANLAEIARIRDAKQRDSIELFKRNVAKGQVLELPNATHDIIQSNPREVLEAIEHFLASLGS